MTDLALPPGWYGKLPSLGDFASRRLPSEFIEPWDRWLGECMAALRTAQGPGWLDAYLHSPTWRFVLMPGVVPGIAADAGWAGVLMPSVDRVGRYFPLTLATPLAPLPGSTDALERLLVWLQQLEEVALDALQDDWRIEQLEEALHRFPSMPERGVASSAEQALTGALQRQSDAFVVIEGVADAASLSRLWARAVEGIAPAGLRVLAGGACWIAGGARPAQLMVSRGLPQADSFIRMFGTEGSASADPAHRR